MVNRGLFRTITKAGAPWEYIQHKCLLCLFNYVSLFNHKRHLIMNKKIWFILLTTFLIKVNCWGQHPVSWDKWNWLIGEWKGEGTGQPGAGSGVSVFSFDLNQNILTKKGHSEYPATDKKPNVVHDDMMIIYSNGAENPSKAIYFDNEGHVINYIITYADKTITLTGEKLSNAPVFRLTYSWLSNDMMDTRFEISQDGEKFMMYIQGKSKKVK